MDFPWIPFYRSCAGSLLRSKGHELYLKVREAAENAPLMHYLHFENNALWEERNFEIDPFSVLGIFNRGVSPGHRSELAGIVARLLGVNMTSPTVFHGIPHLDPRKSIYAGNAQMWELFRQAMAGEPGQDFAKAWDEAVQIKGNALGVLSMGLFWCAPERFMPVDAISAPFIEKNFGIPEPAQKCAGSDYLDYMHSLAAKAGANSFPAMAFNAWKSAENN